MKTASTGHQQCSLFLILATLVARADAAPTFTELGWGSGSNIFNDGNVDEEGAGHVMPHYVNGHLANPPAPAPASSPTKPWCNKAQQKKMWQCGNAAGKDAAKRCKCCDVACTVAPCKKVLASAACQSASSHVAKAQADQAALHGAKKSKFKIIAIPKAARNPSKEAKKITISHMASRADAALEKMVKRKTSDDAAALENRLQETDGLSKHTEADIEKVCVMHACARARTNDHAQV